MRSTGGAFSVFRHGATCALGALIGEESALLWLLHLQPSGRRSGEQGEIVAGIGAALPVQVASAYAQVACSLQLDARKGSA